MSPIRSVTGAIAIVVVTMIVAGCDGGGSPAAVGAPPRAALGASDPRVAEAIEALHRRIAAAPADAALRGELGMTYEAHGVHGAALEAYEQAAALDPAAPRWPYLAALELARRGSLDEALVRLGHSIELDGSYVPAHLRRGQWLLDLGRLDEADRAFERAEAIDPAETTAPLGRARVSLARGAFDEAVARLESLATRRRGDPYVVQLLGSALVRAGDRARGRELLASARGARPPRFADPRHDAIVETKTGFGAEMAMAEDMLGDGRHAEAIALLERLRLERPDDTALLNNLSVAYRQAGRQDDAFAVLEDGLARHPDYFAFHLNIASDHARRGDADRALFHLTRASELNPTIARPYLLKGQLLIQARRLDDALDAFESVLRYEPRQRTALLYGGVLSLELGRLERADELLVRALQQAPGNTAALIGLATTRMRRGDLDSADELLGRVEALDPAQRQLPAARNELERRRGEGR